MTRIKWLGIIRITALLLVLVYHFFKRILPGGFFGVDVFFVLSGFLITVSMLSEFHDNGNFRLFAFYKRRFKRIYFPLAVSVLFSLPFALLISPDFITNIGRQVAAALGFVTNYFEIQNGGSYEARLLPHLFVHTWFLAVEIHLYLVWGFFCALIAWLAGKIFKESNDKGFVLVRIVLFFASVTGALFSYLRMQTMYNISVLDPSPAYFDTFSHAFPFLLGSAGAVLFGTGQKKEAVKNRILIILAVILIICVMAALFGGLFVLAYNLDFLREETYRWGFLAVSLAALVLIFLARVLHTIAPDFNEPRLLNTASNLSYTIYLFHWPLYTVFFYRFWNNFLAVTLAMAVSVVLSIVVFFYMEPLFYKKPERTFFAPFYRRAFYAVLALVVLGAVALNGFIFARAPIINSLEAQLDSGYLYQDIDKIRSLERQTKNINEKPLYLPEEKPNITRLRMGLTLPAYQIQWEATRLYPEVAGILSASYSSEILPGVIVIGDSVCLGARKTLTESIPNCYVDTEGSRQMWQGYNVIMQMQDEYILREFVVVALGTNQNANSVSFIDKIITDIRPGHKLIFVTPYNGSMDETWNTYKIMEYLRTLPGKYHFVTVADWAAQVGVRFQFLGSDKIHIAGNPFAVNSYVDCIVDAINTASSKPAK